MPAPKMTQDAGKEQPVLTEFTIFSKFPLEVRLHIWGLAAPEGVIVVQRESQTPGRRFVYIRSIPGVLHACRESRTEYLETDDPTDKTLQRRQKAHPVYKLHCQEGTVRSRVGKPAVFISTDVDTFYGQHYRGKVVGRDRWTYNFYSGIADLSIAKDLKHLAVSDHIFNASAFETIREKFPALERLTLFVAFYPSPERLDPTSTLVYEAEVDGQLNELTFQSIHPYYSSVIGTRMGYAKEALQQLYEKNPTKTFPEIKWRFRGQVIPEEPAIEARASDDEAEEE